MSGCYSRECGHCGDPWPWPKPLLDRVWWWAGPGLAVYSFSYVVCPYKTKNVPHDATWPRALAISLGTGPARSTKHRGPSDSTMSVTQLSKRSATRGTHSTPRTLRTLQPPQPPPTRGDLTRLQFRASPAPEGARERAGPSRAAHPLPYCTKFKTLRTKVSSLYPSSSKLKLPETM